MRKFILALLSFFNTVCSFSTEYHFQVDIKGKGDPLLFIPGIGCSGEAWNSITDLLSEKYCCYVVTLNGFAGRSSNEIEVAKIPEEIITFIKKEIKKKPVLIGHSFGGFLAYAIAAEAGDLLKGVVVVDSYPFYLANLSSSITVAQAKVQADKVRKDVVGMPDSLFIKQQASLVGLQSASNENKLKILNWVSKSDKIVYAEALEYMLSQDLREKIKAIKPEILIILCYSAITGMPQEKIAANVSVQFGNLPKHNIQFIEGMHFIILDEPAKIVTLTSEYLKNIK
ncbi:MAG TPA: alpha/beta hydrolase [Chitinophagaceae bacterium]|nr:alpha/beta hydrolase [Chitinophagaceae bacterium]